MTPTFEMNDWRILVRGLLLATLLLCGGQGSMASAQSASAGIPTKIVPAEESFDVTGLLLSGLVRTSRPWLESYIDVSFPMRMTNIEALAVARKVMTTGVFTNVVATLESVQGSPGQFLLHIHVEEKWTMIPVVRGVYGGGTPLRILGIYDTHSFGRLLTLGGEVRKYGDAPPGYVLYARDPRSQAGRYYFGAEFWRDFRRRQIYDRDGEEIGSASTDAAISRLRMLTPIGFEGAKDYRWKYGIEIETVQESPSQFVADPDALIQTPPDDLDFVEVKQRHMRLLPTLLFDNVDVDIVENDGIRLKVRGGPTFSAGTSHGSLEAEFFGYQMWPQNFNLATHAFVGQTSYTSIQSQYFLGGLDSIRGMPDGGIYGSRAAFGNIELRHVSFKTKYLWLQSVGFADLGGAGMDWLKVTKDVRVATGLGLRFAIPQIYRMIFRIDYAWTLDGSRNRGVTAGMSQFFDPYTPL